ncbi:SIS domain-containing protein [Fodinicurvata sp. EGI_FJ10296]|uniref:SIS domain-containing protein n=1 Tax=Fodinicurvata sp. EGI_FJ10296 TaxID=3231908 RepID=UPI003451ED8D
MTRSLSSMAETACAEIAAVFQPMDDTAITAINGEIRSARKIALYGVGREGLMMKAFAMRLYHCGLGAHVVGDMTTPPLGNGDLLIVSAGPGSFSTVEALMKVARGAGARIVCVTAQPDGTAAALADTVITLPAQTMADDRRNAAGSILPMGSLYEGAQYVFFEVAILALRDDLGLSPDAMRANHTNLE